jgi:uncharacterized protein
MMVDLAKRVFLVHGWGGSPDEDWFPWLSKMLIERKFDAFVPRMPDSFHPHIDAWVNCLSEVVGDIDNRTYFVGHSIGCQAILRYLESLDGNTKVGGAVFIAGWFHLKEGSIETEEDKEIASEWIDSRIDFSQIKKHLDRSVALFSDNDPDVPLSEAQIFEKELGSKVIIHPKRGHFTAADGVTELHLALNEILKMAKD